MNADSNDDRKRASEDAQRQQRLTYASSIVTTHTYEYQVSRAPESLAPERTPIDDEEMDSLMMLLRDFRTRLLWYHCEWAEEARKGRLSAAQLGEKAEPIFQRLREQFVAHLVAMLDACPAPIVVEMLSKDDCNSHYKMRCFLDG